MPSLKAKLLDNEVSASDAVFELYTNHDITILSREEVVFDVDLKVRDHDGDNQGSFCIHHEKNNAYKLEVLTSEKDSYQEWIELTTLFTNNTNEEYEIKRNTLIATLNIFDFDYFWV